MDTIESGVHKKGSLSLLTMLNHLKSCADFYKAGGIGMFVGVMRGRTFNGETVEKLELEAYEKSANEIIKKICSDLRKKPGIVDVLIFHFTGEFKVGEDLVYVIVAAAHRKDIFPILEEAVERYKKEAPIFKKEYVLDKEGKTRSYWIGEEEKSRLKE
jgi:molybdopterin synthase catalytic subunit